MDKPVIYCVVGPTASGKTSLSIKLAKKINAEIISADSMQIYKELDIGSAKATKEEQEKVKHHLIDIVDISQSYNVSRYKEDCYEKIEEILSKGKNVVITGGTGLYVSSVINNMQFLKNDLNSKEESKYRDYLYELLEKNSKEYMHQMLFDVDPVSAENIHPNNVKRVIRALEIYKFSNKKSSQHMEEEKKRLEMKENIPYDFKVFYLDFKREELYDRINKRVDIMMDNRLEKEAKMVYDKKLSPNMTCMQAIGYKEFFDYFEGRESIEEVVEKIKKGTRNYAKRQVTWFKKIEGIIYIDASVSHDILVDKILEKE